MSSTNQLNGSLSVELAKRIDQALQARRTILVGYSHELHADPEVSGVEFRAAERTRKILGEEGFRFDRPQPGAETAVSARFGDGELVVSLCVEYDALPEIGHACGHNVNAAASLGAALALRDVADDLRITVHVLGTPAEESHGGKVDLINEGYFDQSHAAAMVHAAGADGAGNSSLALNAWRAVFTGRPAHAASAPHEGVNALDALHVAQTAIAVARQQLPAGSVVSLIVQHGGDAVNVIPERAEVLIEMRAADAQTLQTVNSRVENCLRAGALATGCGVDIEPQGHTFADLRQDEMLVAAYVRALGDRGRRVPINRAPVASTDMGNVSHVVPSIHPMIGYDVAGAVHHSAEFAHHGNGVSADKAVMDGAYGLAIALSAAAYDPGWRARLLSLRARNSGSKLVTAH